MLILWTLLMAAVSAHKVYESTEDIGPEAFQNVTTLYPISHNPINLNKTVNTTTNEKNEHENQISENDNNGESNDTNSKEDKPKLDATVWKIDAAFSNSNLEDDMPEKENITEDVPKMNDTKEFKPSPQLGNFFDEDNFEVTPTKASYESFMPVNIPTSGFVSSSKDEFRSSFTKLPKQIFDTHKQFPYKFSSPILTRLKDPWRERPDSLESKPTVEIPVSIPAGGFYKYKDPFRDKPGNDYADTFWKNQGSNNDDSFKTGNDEDDFGLGFTEGGKDGGNTAVKKRVNQWENFLRLVTAFLPVGLIISALTPSLITIEHPGKGIQGHNYPSNMFRRSDSEASGLPTISERCRRRLLCELHSENNYQSSVNSPIRRGKACYKIHCDDADALARTLQWLLEYRKSTQNRQNFGYL